MMNVIAIIINKISFVVVVIIVVDTNFSVNIYFST